MTQTMLSTVVRYWTYLEDYAQHREELLAIVDTVMSSGRLILGNRVQSFENNFASFCESRHGVGVNSGTDALFLSLKALGIGEGDEVITVANTAVPTVAAIRSAGARPVFVDVEGDTFLMNASKVPEAITSRTRCLLPVHLCGQPADMAPLLELARCSDLCVIEDCAQATGATYRGRRVGSLGDVGAFSFYPTKILGGYGDGGMAVTSSNSLFRKLKRLRFYGMEDSYYSEEEGYNSRLDELHAALLEYRLGLVDAQVRRRQEIAAIYSRELAGIGDLVLPVVQEGRSHQFYLYTVRTRERDRLQAYLAAQGIETRINYPVPVHLMRGYSSLGYRKGDLPVTEQLADEILSLPMHHMLSQGEIDRAVAAVRRFFRME